MSTPRATTAPAVEVSPLGAATEVWRSRSGARTRADIAYLLYLVVLTVLVLGAPVGRLAADALARPDVLVHLRSSDAPPVVTAVWLALCAVLVLAGAVRGPAVLTRFFTATLASSALPRWRALARPFLRSALATTFAAGVIAVLVGATLETAGHASTGAVALLVVAALGAGLLGAFSWLVGESAPQAVRRVVALVLLVGAALLAWSPVWLGGIVVGLGAAYPPVSSGAWAFALVGAGLVATVLGLRLLDRVRGDVLREQAERWESVTVMAGSGDLASAAGAFRTPPSGGRRLPAVRVPARPGSLSTLRLYLRRDLVTLGRAPERTVAGLLGAVLGGVVLGAAMQLPGPVGWTVLGVGALVLWAATGAFAEGMRHAVATLGAPGLLGQSAERQTALHAVAPLAIVTLCAAGGALATGGLAALLLPLLLAPVLVAGRVRDAAKGPMPLRLTMPMPTAQGDASVVPMLFWQADALLIALVAAIALRLGLGSSVVIGVLVAAGAVLLLLTGARSRFSALRD